MSKFQTFLFFIALAGFVAFLFEAASERKVRADRDRLAGIYGRLDIVDPNKFYLRQIPTEDPMDFAWRCYVPPGMTFHGYQSMFRYGGRHLNSVEQNPGLFVKRVRFLPQDDGVRLDHFGSGFSSSGRAGLRKEAWDFLQNHWHELDVSVLGDQDQIELDPNKEIATLLTIAIPKHLQQRASELAGDNQHKNLSSAWLMKLEFGAETVFSKK